MPHFDRTMMITIPLLILLVLLQPASASRLNMILSKVSSNYPQSAAIPVAGAQKQSALDSQNDVHTISVSPKVWHHIRLNPDIPPLSPIPIPALLALKIPSQHDGLVDNIIPLSFHPADSDTSHDIPVPTDAEYVVRHLDILLSSYLSRPASPNPFDVHNDDSLFIHMKTS